MDAGFGAAPMDAGFGAAPVTPVSDFGSPAVSDFASGGFESAPASQVDGPLEQYEREHRKRLIEKEEESNARRQREIEEAKKEIAEYFEERKRRTEKNREKHNASTESSQNSPFDAAEPWKNIASLVDLDAIPNNKEKKDVSRLREVLKQVA
jgi:vacuolar-type H+-ATPase subunit I/STV1